LVEDLGFNLSSTKLRRTGYSLRYERAGVGVEVAFEVRDTATVRVCRIDAVHGWPRAPGEIGPGTLIERANLHDLETVAGRPHTAVAWSIPTQQTIAAYADSLRAEHDLLQGDFTALEAASILVRNRAREAAEAKWGTVEAARRWVTPSSSDPEPPD
jgi:hypothetical protein